MLWQNKMWSMLEAGLYNSHYMLLHLDKQVWVYINPHTLSISEYIQRSVLAGGVVTD